LFPFGRSNRGEVEMQLRLRISTSVSLSSKRLMTERPFEEHLPDFDELNKDAWAKLMRLL